MRVAICLSGLVRTYRQTYDNFKTQLLDPNQHHSIDVFISTWPTDHSNNSMERTRRLAWYGASTPPFPEEPIDYYDLQEKYKPKCLAIEAPITFKVPWYVPTPGINIQSLMCMVYKIYACDLLRRSNELVCGYYDVVIRMRFDGALPFPIIIDQLDLDSITVPSMMQERYHPDYNWTNDKFAAGNSASMTAYSNWYLHMEFLSKQALIQPEIMLNQHLVNHQIPIKEWGEELPLVRFQ